MTDFKRFAKGEAGTVPVSPANRPQDTYHWGETMKQYAALGIGTEAWVELEQAEERAKRASFAPTSGVVLNWRTFKLVMTVLRGIRIEDFQRANPVVSAPADPVPVSPAMLDLRQGCVCACCDHSEGSDCGCECHSEGACAFQFKAAVVSAPAEPQQEETKNDKNVARLPGQ